MALVSALAVACSRTPSANPMPGAAPSASATTSAAAVQSATAFPPLLGDGCHAGVSLAPTNGETLKQVRAQCFPDAVTLREPSDETAPKQLSFHVDDASACLRIAAVGAKRDNVELVLRDEKGVELARDALPGAIALLSARGPVCVPGAGDYRLELGGSGSVSVGIWRAP